MVKDFSLSFSMLFHIITKHKILYTLYLSSPRLMCKTQFNHVYQTVITICIDYTMIKKYAFYLCQNKRNKIKPQQLYV